MSKAVKAILVACGTASSNALGVLSERLEVPIVGVIEGAVDRAYAIAQAGTGKVAILGTAATIQSGAFERALREKDPALRILPRACPMFVPLVENGYIARDCEVTRTIAAEYVSKLVSFDPDVIILGCTHYPLLEEVISDYMGPDVTLIDSGAEAANLASTQFNPNDGPGGTRYYVSDDPAGFDRLAGLFLQEDVETNAGLVDISRF